MSLETSYRQQLNFGLEVEDLVIWVPKGCHLDGFGRLKNRKIWEDYKDLRGYRSPVKKQRDKKFGCCGHWHWCCYPLHGQDAIDHAIRVHDRVHRQILRFQGVSAVDVGFAVRERERKFCNVLALRIHVENKLSPHLMSQSALPDLSNPLYALVAHRIGLNRVDAVERKKRRRFCRRNGLNPWRSWWGQYMQYPVSGVLPSDLTCWDPCPEDHPGDPWSHCRLCVCGVPIDVIDARYFPSVQHPGGDAESGVFVEPPAGSDELSNEELLLTGKGPVNPLVGGISVGSVSGQAGTLGTVVWDKTDGTPCVLSNWHVLANTASAQVGQPTYQPALFDGGTKRDVVARLKRWHLGEYGDAAIAELDHRRSYASGEILGMWHPISGYRKPRLNMEVRKWGRTTGFTQGFVDGVHLATNINYGGGVVRYFKSQFHIAPLLTGQDVSQVGDSGSLVLTSFPLDDLELIYIALWGFCRSPGKFEKFKEYFLGLELDRPELAGLWLELFADLEPLDEEALADLEGQLAQVGINASDFASKEVDRANRTVRNVYYAVGMIFAGDTPGSPFGEFALASDLKVLADELRFSLRPVFEPRSSFRELRNRPKAERSRRRRGRRGRDLRPGRQEADPRGQGPQPDPEPAQTGPQNNNGG